MNQKFSNKTDAQRQSIGLGGKTEDRIPLEFHGRGMLAEYDPRIEGLGIGTLSG
jgi:hypothetical protein